MASINDALSLAEQAEAEAAEAEAQAAAARARAEELRTQKAARDAADEVAAAADLVKGKTDGIPAALVRGLDAGWFATDTPGARAGPERAARTTRGSERPAAPAAPTGPRARRRSGAGRDSGSRDDAAVAGGRTY